MPCRTRRNSVIWPTVGGVLAAPSPWPGSGVMDATASTNLVALDATEAKFGVGTSSGGAGVRGGGAGDL